MKQALLSFPILALATACSQGSAVTPISPPSAEPAPKAAADGSTCGPQSPRDISMTAGENLAPVPAGDAPNLCNVHFHDPFEHAGFDAVPPVTGAPGDPVCESVEVGDRLEFHWVYTSCPVSSPPVEGLANCVCDNDDMVLRVYAQAYVVGEGGQAPARPSGDLVSYAGSTTGPSYDNQTCSPARVRWEVNPRVEVLDKAALDSWCKTNPWIGEDHPHESRELVTNPAWLSPR